MSRTVILKRKANATNLPDHVYAEAKRKIGSTFGANGDINTGLSFGEQKKWLPGIIGVDSKDVNFQKEVKKYFQNLTILVENSGTKLEVGLDQDGDPINLMDYVKQIEKCLGKKSLKLFKEMQPGDLKNTLSDNSLLQNLTNFKPTTSIKLGISEFIKWYLKHYH